MSPADVILLLDWLDAKVGVIEILLALERLAASRQKNQARAPFTLAKAKRHLGRPTQSRLPTQSETPAERNEERPSAPEHPLAALVDWIREDVESQQEDSAQLLRLASELEALPVVDREALTQKAIALVRGFHQFIWNGLDSAVREGYIRNAVAQLDTSVVGIDDAALLRNAEESARAELRERYPVLNAATIWDLMKHARNH